MRNPQDRYLPPDRAAFAAATAKGRVIVIAPTRAACETIELALGLHIRTFLEENHGAELRQLAALGQGFGIVAGTGTGKTLAIRPIAETILGTTSLRVGVVNREREATPETPTWNVIIVTTGIARRWFQDDDITAQDVLVVDEIHQTSAELELCLALGKRVGCRFIWLSATVDPTFYASYLESKDVLQVSAFDPSKAATVKVDRRQPIEFLDDRFLRKLSRSDHGVAVFLPTRASAEEVAEWVTARYPRINTAHYHGGEPIRVIRPFLEGAVPRPFLLTMTAAGQSALNVPGLDTVIIDDTRFANVIDRGRNVLTRVNLGANEILQMAGRVHGRVAGGRVFILSDREVRFEALKPVAPEFQLAGDSERVALTCADLGVRADELELPVPLDRKAYRRALALLESRGLVADGRLTPYGRAVEALPVDRAWGELIVNADDDLLPVLSVMSGIESLYRMTRDERNLDGVIVRGSDHLTAYNLYAEAFRKAGYTGTVYGLPRHLFDEEAVALWAERRGVLVKALEDAALAMASVYRSVGLPLPTEFNEAKEGTLKRFQELLARYMPFDLVIEEETADGGEARVARTSVAGSWGAVAGTLRYFADRHGIPRASIEGTQLPMALIRRHAVRHDPGVVLHAGDARSPLSLERRVTYFGFELSREAEPLVEFGTYARQAHLLLAEAAARGELRHRGVQYNKPLVEEIRRVWRKLGGRTRRLDEATLASWYLGQLDGTRSWPDVLALPMHLDIREFITDDDIAEAETLPDSTQIRGREIALQYAVEEKDGTSQPVVRLILPEKLARTLVEEEVPAMDGTVRFMVLRGKRGSVHAATLSELQLRLDLPFTELERERGGGQRGSTGDYEAGQRGRTRGHEAGQRGRSPRARRSGSGRRTRSHEDESPDRLHPERRSYSGHKRSNSGLRRRRH